MEMIFIIAAFIILVLGSNAVLPHKSDDDSDLFID